MSERLSGDGALIFEGEAFPIHYTLVFAIGGRRRSASGVVTSAGDLPDSIFRSAHARLRLDDGMEFSVALRRKAPGGPALLSSLGSDQGLKLICLRLVARRSMPSVARMGVA